MDFHSVLERLTEAKKEITADDLDDNMYYSFRLFHIPQNRDMGTTREKGKKLKALLTSTSYRITNIKSARSPQEDEQAFRNKKKAQARWSAAWDGPRK